MIVGLGGNARQLQEKWNMATVADLIEFLQKHPQDLPVAIKMYSETSLLEFDSIKVKELCEARPDGWVQNKRPDMPTRMYLVFPGN